ncbi:MAG: YciI family protein [Leptospira sp.]|nr:YciI family protein [Leptospira sp.]
MKHFIVTLEYIVPIEEIDKYLSSHREFLDKGYEKKILLASGPRNPREGGILLARALSLSDMKEFCSNDPFFINKCAEYKFTEFIPVKFQSDFQDWFLGSDV